MHQGTVGSNWRDDLNGISGSFLARVPIDNVRKILCHRSALTWSTARTQAVSAWHLALPVGRGCCREGRCEVRVDLQRAINSQNRQDAEHTSG
jgi:hypothetical protein